MYEDGETLLLLIPPVSLLLILLLLFDSTFIRVTVVARVMLNGGRNTSAT